ncbi:ABC transporter ATP-binding protein [Alicyclobacillus contaminans]|uniref:ABC transporter ATP-binding protein n=1 Tax=Alicyclobacillus contaminans TaxID=392016 RepID=UPI00040F0757|nr:ABC transporter ATP-binding protein [Alicyclobacillus contaminans]
MSDALLEISDLRTSFKSESGYMNAVAGVSLSLRAGETVGLVGESGCGKSVTSLSIMQLLPKTAKVEGSIRFQGKDLLAMKEPDVRKFRGNEISMIFQEPMTALNPVLRIGDQIAEPLRMHKKLSKRELHDRVIELLKQVGIPRPEQIVKEYPHQLSGGMRQRVMIAMAMACEPKLLIADEPTTALDVTVQAQILDLLRELQARNNMALLLITHDLGVVAEMCERVIVMYAGKVVEEGDVRSVFRNPQHPYTSGLLNSIPKLIGERERLQPIRGNVPSLANMPPGCRFAPRCPHAKDICHTNHPSLLDVEAGHKVSCWMAEEVAAR